MFAKAALALVLTVLLWQPAWANSDADNDGILGSDQCPMRPEIVNRLLDLDGCPDTILLHLMGEVVDAASGQPVTAEIKIAGPAGVKKLTLTQRYELKTGVEGAFSVEVAAVGYKTQRGAFMLKRGQALRLVWALVRE